MADSYAQAGVDIDAGNQAVDLYKKSAGKATRPEVLGGLGGFGGFFALQNGYKQPVLVAGTDGVGTKLKLAFSLNKHDTIGQDLVAMCVNDIVTSGAEPLFFLDYFATGKLSPTQAAQVVDGIAQACGQANCALLGGETAEMPGFYPPGEYDVAGFAVGVVEREELLDGSGILPGDVVLGIPSSGLHSNGFSLARKVLLSEDEACLQQEVPELSGRLGEVLLTPTRLYVKETIALTKKKLLKGAAHITGGGLLENIPRILPAGVGVDLNTSAWVPSPVFQYIGEKGRIPKQDMYRAFNMGIGMVYILSPEKASEALNVLKQAGCGDARIIGTAIAGGGVTIA